MEGRRCLSTRPPSKWHFFTLICVTVQKNRTRYRRHSASQKTLFNNLGQESESIMRKTQKARIHFSPSTSGDIMNVHHRCQSWEWGKHKCNKERDSSTLFFPCDTTTERNSNWTKNREHLFYNDWEMKKKKSDFECEMFYLPSWRRRVSVNPGSTWLLLFFSVFKKKEIKNQAYFHETSRRKTKPSFRTALFLLSASKTFSYFLIVEAKIHFFSDLDPLFKRKPSWLKQTLAGDRRVATVPGALFSRLDKTQRVLKHYKNIYIDI